MTLPSSSLTSTSTTSATTNELPLTGYCFAISGKLSMPRAEFEAYIKENGGSIAKSITKACTHLIRLISNYYNYCYFYYY